MSKYKGGIVSSVENTPSGTAYTGKANGMWSLQSQVVAKTSSLWAAGQSIPNPPIIGTANTVTATSISVPFTLPVLYGGLPITNYTVTSSGGQTATGASSPIIVTGLTTGTSYTFTVTATNAFGTSANSNTSNSVVAATLDPYFNNVSLLLTGDDLNDHSSAVKTITSSGTVSVNTTTKKYGTGSIYFNSGYLTSNTSSNFDIGTEDFTIEFWHYPETVPNGTYPCLFSIGNSSHTIAFFINHASWPGKYTLDWNSSGGTANYTTTTSYIANQWSHLALVRNSGTVKFYINGVVDLTLTDAQAAGSFLGTAGTSYCRVNARGDGALSNCVGYFDDVRITKGVARYTSNFTPPTAALPTS